MSRQHAPSTVGNLERDERSQLHMTLWPAACAPSPTHPYNDRSMPSCAAARCCSAHERVSIYSSTSIAINNHFMENFIGVPRPADGSSHHRGRMRHATDHVFCFLFADVDAACLAFRRLSLMRLRCLFKHSLHVFLSSSKCARSASIRLQVLHFLFGASSGTSGTGVMGRSANIAASKSGRPSSSNSILKRITDVDPRIRSAWMCTRS
jgi:hypothetical protein